MSEYQRYEFMTIDRPLSGTQLAEVEELSSHIEASSTHAIIEYHWGDFKHDPIKVLHKYFDGFLYWANWGSPELAFRFPRGVLPADLIEGYDFDDFVTFTHHKDYDILDIHFPELEAPDMWTEYELGTMIAIRDELMEGDLRALYIAWLASQNMIGDYDEEDYDEDDEGEEDYEISVPPVPPGLGSLTSAQEALMELLQVPRELLVAAARQSSAATPRAADDFAAWVKLLPQERQHDYLVRLALNEPGLSRLLVRELRELGQDRSSAPPSTGEHVNYNTLVAESRSIKVQLEREQREREQALERERREREQAARQRRLQDIHEHQESFWRQVEKSVARNNASGYDDAAALLVDLRDSAAQFNESQAFEARFRAWIPAHVRRPAFLKRLQAQRFPLPEA